MATSSLFALLLLSFLSLSSSSPSAESCNNPGITLHYWNGRGLMEVTRVILAMNGLFPGEGYEDARWMTGLDSLAEGEVPVNPRPYQDVGKFVPVDVNAGRLPILVEKQKSGEEIAIGQSLAIWWFVAEKFDFLGELPHHQAQILSILETLKEMKDAYRKLAPYGEVPTEENQKKWFEGGADDYTGTANTPRRNERYLKFWLGRLENQISGKEGFSVGNKLSLADIVIHNALSEFLEEENAAEGVLAWQREPFSDLAQTKALLASHPKLNSICDTVNNNGGFQKWLKVRGVQSF